MNLIAIAVLDEYGEMVCDADVRLSITYLPQGRRSGVTRTTALTTKDGHIQINPECYLKEKTNKPDYQTTFTTEEVGIYEVTLTATTNNGTFSVDDRFEVQDRIPFQIERTTATRIFPKEDYPVQISVSVQEDFKGTVIEKVPESFILSDAYLIDTSSMNQTFSLNDSGGESMSTTLTDPIKREPHRIYEASDLKLMEWDVDWKKGETYVIHYTYDAKNFSPAFYSLGPLTLSKKDIQTYYQEARQWSIAVDAIGDIGHWRDSIGGQIPGTTFAAFEFDQQIRNDGIYSRPNNSTIQLDEAGSYLIISTIRGVDNSNGRYNAQARVALTSGSGSLFTSYYTGYSRDASEDTSWFRAVGVVLNATANTQVQVQRRRDTDAPTSGSVAGESDVQVVRINPDNYGLYAMGATSGSVGGTTPNTMDVTAVTVESSTSAIEGNTSTDTITVKGDNKRYLTAWSVSGDTGGSRTQRIGHLEYNGTDALDTRSYCYQRNGTNEYCGIGSMDLIETSTADVGIQVEVFRGPGVAADNGGADVDGSFDLDGNGQIIVLELPDYVEVFKSHDSIGLQNITSAATLNAMRD
ncbi:hypothetical protein KC573_01690, partial [candidate division WWE3 bacterium]|nr:hypothetical protein [candidate division WWE3 bacterium]